MRRVVVPLGAVVWGFYAAAPLGDVLGVGRANVESAYILLVPIVVAYIFAIRSAAQVSEWRDSASGFGVLMALAGVIIGYIGRDRDVLFMWHSSPILCLWGLAVAVKGLEFFLMRLPAFLALLFMVPVPGTIRQIVGQPLQAFSAGLTADVLNLVGIIAVRVGNLIEIEGRQVAVGEACDGMRLLMPLLVVMYAFVFSLPLTGFARLGLLALCGPAAILCNVVRLLLVSMAYSLRPEYAEQAHDILGWAMLPLAILLLVGLLRLFGWLDLPVSRFRLGVV